MNKKTILVIDDQAIWRNLLCEILEDEFDVQSAASYTEAREILLKQKPPFHVIVSDIRLVDGDPTNEDGLRLIEELARGNQTKVIVITGYPTIKTAKKALKDLTVYDYLQKVPSDGRLFDTKVFLDLVRQAAEEADQQRSGAIYIPHRAVVIESNSSWRKKISGLLRSDGYIVQEIDQEISSLLKEPFEYDLLVVNEVLLDEHLQDFLQHHPGIETIILTDKNADFARKISGLRASAVMPIQNGFDEQELRIKVYQAFNTQMTKYVSLNIEEDLDIFEQGKTYRLHLEISETPRPNSKSLTLEPKTIRGNRLALKVSIYAPGIKFPNTEVIWRIPLAPQSLEPLTLEFAPQEAGEKMVILEIGSENQGLARIEKKLQVK